MNIQQELFGTTHEGTEISRFILSNDREITATVTNFGATLTSLTLPDRNGNIEEVTLGFDTLEEYTAGTWFCGATIGRYANRMKDGRFTLDGCEYQLDQNSFPSHLHGGQKGFHKKVWTADTNAASDSVSLILSCVSNDGEEGYPGNVSVTVTYTLNNQNELRIAYLAETDQATPINLTNHTYWNLKGVGAGNALDHELILYADTFLPTDADRIPTGEIRRVHGTPMDFTQPATIGARINQITGGGYNHCYVFDKPEGALARVASVHEPTSGRVLEISTTEPGMQFYSGHFLDNCKGADGVIFHWCDAICLEAQHFPNSVNQPEFPSTILRPGETYTQTTIHTFSTEK